MNYYMKKRIDFTIFIRYSTLTLLTMVFLFSGCKDDNYGLYTAFVSYCSSTINPDSIELRLISDTDFGTPLHSEKMNIFVNPSDTNSIRTCQYSARTLYDTDGKSSFLMFKYGMGRWVTIDSQDIQKDEVFTKHIFIGRKSLHVPDSIVNYHFVEYQFNGIADTVFFF